MTECFQTEMTLHDMTQTCRRLYRNSYPVCVSHRSLSIPEALAFTEPVEGTNSSLENGWLNNWVQIWGHQSSGFVFWTVSETSSVSPRGNAQVFFGSKFGTHYLWRWRSCGLKEAKRSWDACQGHWYMARRVLTVVVQQRLLLFRSQESSRRESIERDGCRPSFW